MKNEVKLVEALKCFMERSIIPYLPEQHPALNEWKFLNGIVSNTPIDYTQLDFYLLMVNRGNPAQQQQPQSARSVNPVPRYPK